MELAADEPDGSPTAEVCWYLAHEVRNRGHASATRNIAELRKNAADGRDGAHLVLGAVLATVTRPETQEPQEMIRRAGWLSITGRRDVLAHRVADFAQRWDDGQDWHTGAVTGVHSQSSTTAHEWAQRLGPADSGQPPHRLGESPPGQRPRRRRPRTEPRARHPNAICWVRTQDGTLWLAPE